MLVYRTIPFILISAVLSFGLTLMFQPSIASGAQNTSGWTLSQLSRLFGKQTVKFDSNHVRMENLKTGLVSVLTGPPWKIAFYNPRQKLIYETDFWYLEAAMSDGFSGDGDLETIEKSTVSPASGDRLTIAGLKTNYYTMRDYTAYRTRNVHAGKRDQMSALPSVEPMPMVSIDYWASSEIKVPPQVSLFISKLCRIPHASGIPLRVKAQDVNNRRTTVLDTYQCVAGKVPPAEFIIPKGYKRTKTFRELVFDEGTQNQALEMMRGFMDADEEAEKKPKKKK